MKDFPPSIQDRIQIMRDGIKRSAGFDVTDAQLAAILRKILHDKAETIIRAQCKSYTVSGLLQVLSVLENRPIDPEQIKPLESYAFVPQEPPPPPEKKKKKGKRILRPGDKGYLAQLYPDQKELNEEHNEQQRKQKEEFRKERERERNRHRFVIDGVMP